MKPLFTLIALFLSAICFAQRQNVYFLKNNGRYVDARDSADYLRIVREPDSASVLYNVFEFYLNNKPKLVGKSTKIDPPRYEGQCITFYQNGNKNSISNYKNGNPNGTEFLFYPNGKVYLVKEYPDNAAYSPIVDNFSIKANYDSLGTALAENGSGYCKLYDNAFKYIAEEGSIKNEKREGVWKGNFENEKTTFTETYANGELVSGTAKFADGQSTTYAKTRSVQPQFNGGISAFSAYLGNNIQYPDYERGNDIQGVVIVEFVVEKDGKISDIKVNKHVSDGLDKEAVRVIKKSPKWIPATVFARPVRVRYRVPVNFALTN
ncbi:energy transducer TonB [Mucilaginibacter sp.]|uniref:energy transducer TonB n=1 Tax=Mucilaginibacter sp. TaxID=1882438 RepID=UPI0025E982E2|nr:energy transducer TonB [Mucilaginibacter sp.]